MAGLIDSLTKSNVDSNSSRAFREVARKLGELEDSQDRTAGSVDDVKKLQKGLSAKLDELEKLIEAEGDRTREAGPVVDLSETDRKIAELKGELGDIKAAVNALGERIEALTEDVNDGMDDNNRRLESLMNQVADAKDKADEEGEECLEDKLEVMKLSLEDTIHKENIKCFRNIQGVLEEQTDGKTYDVSGLKKYVRVTIWFQLITIAIVVLHLLGMI